MPGGARLKPAAELGSIRIGGAWDGALAMTPAARDRTRSQPGRSAVVHDRTAELTAETEVHDGWGELVNSAGGILRARECR